ncbi:hypothetical protein Poli38472_010105 [Pythium oligandrum]|uniref:CWH43-like N-terminal domain-containing protein n=1 Tax=Pythium oligandrum TaxID=41045 RepID=A0A8K1FDN1_PYTOL|nr:hypothetical protein Poli38472_010105 [Pythium oligandrum]|eukprot:TMW58546.1 hypothetical protein Poli38472_010105 [Pythium oligandrum]
MAPAWLRRSLRALWRWRFAPLLAATAVVSTLITCFIITRVKHRYTGGLDWPYFSDMGRDPPSYYVFGVGLSLTAIAIAMTWMFNFIYHRWRLRSLHAGRISICASYAVLIIGVLSTIGLPVLSWCSTTECPTWHDVGTMWFFLLEVLAILINTSLSYWIWRSLKQEANTSSAYRRFDGLSEPPSKGTVQSVKRAFLWQLMCALLLVAVVIVYIPVGLTVAGNTPRLTIAQCLERDLGETYCTQTMRLNDKETTLWNYETQRSANQARAACQLVAMLSLVGYSLSFLFHEYDVIINHARPLAEPAPAPSPSPTHTLSLSPSYA